ncbi:HindVP family restriction endonuclease, partial [Escherichia coli]|nr:HindVP family restriction endonuclease [Escherichia coli]
MSKIESLYGLKNTNRKESDLWGKNQFNSSFPTSLACYMRDNKM